MAKELEMRAFQSAVDGMVESTHFRKFLPGEPARRYDKELQMYCVDEPLEVDHARIEFLRWLGEQNRLEHEIFGPPAGEFARILRGPADRASSN